MNERGYFLIELREFYEFSQKAIKFRLNVWIILPFAGR